MKIKIQLAAIALLMTGLMSSCIMKDDFADCPPKKPLKVISTIDFGGGSTLWPKGSAIGITVLKAGTNECFGNNSDKHYVISDTHTGESVPNESADPIYLPEGEDEADIVAYYPYTATFDQNYKTNLSVLDQSKPYSLDLITSDRVCNVPSDAELIELKFYRRLTKLIFNIKLIEIGADGKETIINEQLPGTSLAVTGMPVTGVYSLPDNKLTLDGGNKDITTRINKEGTNSSAIVFPREAGEGVTFVVTLPDGKKYTFLMDPEQVLKAGTENKFDIVIKLKKDTPAKPEYKVTYELQGDLTPDNIAVKQGSDNAAWSLNQTIIVQDDGSFTFLYNSGLTVTARLSDGTVLDTKNNKPYSFTHIKKDIHIILSAKKTIDPPVDPEPPIDPPVDPNPPVDPEEPWYPEYYKVTYEFIDGLSASNVTVTRGTGTNVELWPTDKIITVQEGSSFTFTYKNNGGTVKSVVINERIITDTKNDIPYKITNIRRDQHVILGGIENHAVKLLINLPDRDPSGVSTLVSDKGNYKFKMPILASEKIIMTINGVDTEPKPDKDGYYTIENILEDKIILITVKKSVASPDAIITADVHEWTILDPIDGGIILPDPIK